MGAETPIDRFRENVVGIVSTLLTGLWLAALFTGQEWWLALMLVSYIVVIPIVALLFGNEGERKDWWEAESNRWSTSEDWFGTRPKTENEQKMTDDAAPAEPAAETPLETLRRRYAAGELTDAQYERKLERLLETDTLENVEERAARQERNLLRDRELERE